MKSTERSRARGALLGLAVGDALGTTLEFSRPPVASFSRLLAGPHTSITGGGPFALAPGEVTDDTQMACCLAASLKERGHYDRADVLARYRSWRAVAFDVGNQTSAGLSDGQGETYWQASGCTAAGNGSLMRTAPIGVFFRKRRSRLMASVEDSGITHADPRCMLACCAYNAAIRAAIDGAGPGVILSQAQWELRLATGLLCGPTAAHAAISSALYTAQSDNPQLDVQARGGGFVMVAFTLAFWELLHAPTFESGLIDVVNRGGDADTNGAIAGALLGALWGEDEIPAAWREAVLGAQGLRPDLHPRVLLDLVA